jgi:uncharacterized secreted protein with C-terminal beta-propeller domain
MKKIIVPFLIIGIIVLTIFLCGCVTQTSQEKNIKGTEEIKNSSKVAPNVTQNLNQPSGSPTVPGNINNSVKENVSYSSDSLMVTPKETQNLSRSNVSPVIPGIKNNYVQNNVSYSYNSSSEIIILRSAEEVEEYLKNMTLTPRGTFYSSDIFFPDFQLPPPPSPTPPSLSSEVPGWVFSIPNVTPTMTYVIPVFTSDGGGGGGGGGGILPAPLMIPALMISATPAVPFIESSASDYSKTNIQVEGIDEADFVKNDGKYIYFIKGSDLFIVDVYPPEKSSIISQTFVGNNPVALYVVGNRAAVIGRESTSGLTETRLTYYSLLNRQYPEKTNEYTIGGNYFDSRLTGETLYLLTRSSITSSNNRLFLPTVRSGNVVVAEPPVTAFNNSEYNYAFLTVTSFSMETEGEKDADTFLMKDSDTLYTSFENIYITNQKNLWPTMFLTGPNDITTVIHRISIINGTIEYGAKGEVPGRLLNQFSLDEFEGFLRVATTSQMDCNVVILDRTMHLVGSLSNIAPGEQIHSARFIGDRLYLVTFRRIDPFFVIDLSQPESPYILGKLKIPGYSDYLHPYDANHIIGIGKETSSNEWGGVVIEGLKLALFDVANVENPTLVGNFVIGGPGTDSEALRDHKAFFFDKSRGLLVIPVKIMSDKNQQMPPDAQPISSPVVSGMPSQWMWDGAYVLGVSSTDGFTLKGTITHAESGDRFKYYGSYNREPWTIRRSILMDDVLSTVSSKSIMMNRLGDLTKQAGKVTIPDDDATFPT